MAAHHIDRVAGRLSERRLSRRAALWAGGAGLAAARLWTGARPAGAQAEAASSPVATPGSEAVFATGQTVPELAGFDAVMTGLMAKQGLPGGQLAVAKDGRLVLDRGYGFADVDRQEPVQPGALFRIASVSKAFTAVAILTLVDAGALTLDTPVFPLLGLAAAPHAARDPRLDTITVEQVLVHAGGWDAAASLDPQYLPWSRMAAATLGRSDPAEATTIVRYMLGVPLDFDPGARQAYSNFGFNLLGRVIEHVSGQPYADFVRDRVLTPAGITTMRMGRTRREDRAPGEVRYYSPPGLPLGESVFWGEGYVPDAYGHYYLEAMDSHGGWLASAADLVRFATAVDGQRGAALLSPEMVRTMLTTPRPKADPGSGSVPVAAGLGWDVRPVAGGAEWSRTGALVGTSAAWVVRSPDGVAMAYTFNSLPLDFPALFFASFDALLAAAGSVQTWPEHDLFAAAGSAAMPGA